MTIDIKPLSSALGAEISGLGPKGQDISESDRNALVTAWFDYGVLLLRGLELGPDEQVELTLPFGEPDIHPIESIRLKDHPEIIVLSTGPKLANASDPAADKVVGRIPWHSDLTYTTHPSRGALLYAIEVPEEGGQTGFVDTARVYDELSETIKKKIEGVEVIHSFVSAREQAKRESLSMDNDGVALPDVDFTEVVHPLVLEQPETGRRALNISPSFAVRVAGMAAVESAALLRELTDFATQDRFVHIHGWRARDLVIWDNFRILHTAFGCKRKYRRVMYRTTIKAERATGRQLAVA